MKRIEPTHIEIMKSLNCGYYGHFCENKCYCTNPHQLFRGCYEKEKEILTKIVYTEEEIEQRKKKNEIAMKELHSFFEELEEETK